MYVIGIVFYCHAASFLNISIQLLTEIDFVISWMSKHQTSTIVQAAKILFGLRYTEVEEQNLMSQKTFHYTIILVNMFCAQAYKQARWGDIKRLTACIDDLKPSMLKRFLYSVLFRQNEKDEAKNRTYLVKELLKKNDRKN